MHVEALPIEGAWVFRPEQHSDPRGTFLEWFTDPALVEVTGHSLALAQVNCSVSAVGALRGVHFADVPPGQAKYVMCATGAVLDVVVDLRVGSSTFGHWSSVLLDDVDRTAVYLAEGLGHAFLSLDDASTVVYLCSQGYAPGRERTVHPLDQELGITWPEVDRRGRHLVPVLSPKDDEAPSLRAALEQGLLPTAASAASLRDELRPRG